MDDGATPVAIRLRRSISDHDAYTVRLAVLATARPSDARRWVATTRWLHHLHLFHGRLVVGLGVQWTPPRRPLGIAPPVPFTFQVCVGHRCVVIRLAPADGVPVAFRQFLADPRVTFLRAGSAHDCLILWAHYGDASMEEMADRILGYPGVGKLRDVSMSAWHAPRLDMDQVLYGAIDVFLAFRLGVHLCPGVAAAHQPDFGHQTPPARVGPSSTSPVRPTPPGPLVLNSPLPPDPRGSVVVHPAPPAQRVARPAPVVQRAASVYVPLRHGPPAPAAAATGVINHAMVPHMECSPRITDVCHDVLPVRAYASDSEDDDYSSDGFEHVRSSSVAASPASASRFISGRHLLLLNPGKASAMRQVCFFLLVIMLVSVSPVACSATKDGSAQIGTCRFDLSSMATLSCLQRDEIWRPPSGTCCKVLRYAIDKSPSASEERGACCLCRYIVQKNRQSPGLAESYSWCNGKDKRIVDQWPVPLGSCYTSCNRRRNADLSGGMGTIAAKESGDLKMPWMSVAVGSVCVIFAVFCWYIWCCKRREKSLDSVPHRLGLDASPARPVRRGPRRRMSTSPNS